MRILEKAGIWGVLLLLALIWGSSFILIKKALIALPSPIMAGYRIFFASSVLMPIGWQRLSSLKTRDWRGITIVAFAGSGIPAFLFAYAQQDIPSAIAGCLNSLTPLFTLLIGFLLFGRGMHIYKIAGTAIGLTGALLLLGMHHGISLDYPLLPVIFILIACMGYGLSTNTIKYLCGHLHPITISSVSMVILGPLAILFLCSERAWEPVLNHPHGLLSLGCVALLGILSTALANVIFMWLNHQTGPVFSSSVTYFIPVIAFFWGVLDGEILDVSKLAGLLLIIFSIFLISRVKEG